MADPAFAVRGWRKALEALWRRPALAAAVFYAVVAIVLVSPALLPGKSLSMSDQLSVMAPWQGAHTSHLPRAAVPATENSDGTTQLRPFLQYTAQRLPGIPLWDPYIMNGRPFMANAQSAVFSLFSVPAYVLGFASSLAWIAVLKWWVAAFGTFLLGRALGMRFGGALLAGLAYGFSFWMVAWESFPHSSVWAWIPWMLLLTECVVRRPTVLAGVGLALVTALQFVAGHPESSFHAVVATVLFFALRLTQRYRRRRSEERWALSGPLLAFGAGLAGGALIAAAQLVPFAELLLHSADLQARSGSAIDGHLPIKWLLQVFMPDYWGRATGTLLEPFQLARAFYLGALPLMLGTLGLLLRRRAERLWIAAFGALSLAVVTGIPPFVQIVTRLPVFSSGHNDRLAVFWVLSVALLAGWGLDELTERRVFVQRRRLLWAAGVVLALPVVVVVLGGLSIPSVREVVKVASGFAKPPYPLAGHPEAVPIIHDAALLEWLVFAGVAFALVALRVRGRLATAPFVALAVLLLVADLFKAGMGYNPAVNRSDTNPPATGAIRYLQRDPGTRFVSQTLDIPDNVIPLRFRLLGGGGYDLPIIKRYDRLWRTQVEPECPTEIRGFLGPYCIRLASINVTERGVRTLGLLDVTRLLQPPNQPLLHLPNVVPAYLGPDARVYRITNALPHAFVAGAQDVDGSAETDLADVTSPRFDRTAVAVTQRALPGVPTDTIARPGIAGRATVIHDGEESVTVRVQASRPGVLVLTDTYYPDWNATVNGQPAPLVQVDYVLRGVPIAAGLHTVRFSYAPASWTVGWITSLLSLLAALVAAGLSWHRRRKQRPPSRPPSSSEPRLHPSSAE